MISITTKDDLLPYFCVLIYTPNMAGTMNKAFLQKIYESHRKPKELPGVLEIEEFINHLLQFLFPELNNKRLKNQFDVEVEYNLLKRQLTVLLKQTRSCNELDHQNCSDTFFEALPTLYDMCLADCEAILKGDPAAVDRKEVIRTYPGFLAIVIHRIANTMYRIGIPYIPRIFSEIAHSKTGIEIHPGATIGHRFCIDHGTGIVIGETTEIGNDVKIYQGVTLGALSVKKELAKKKRHPTIKDNVVIYANATILGGETVVGENSIIGGGVWITESVAPNSKIYNTNMNHSII